MLTLILLAGLQTPAAPSVRFSRPAADIPAACALNSAEKPSTDGSRIYPGFSRFQESPTAEPITIYAGPIGCAGLLSDPKMKTVPTNGEDRFGGAKLLLISAVPEKP